jgi:hypothetical protein
MTQTSDSRLHPLVAFIIGGLMVLGVVLVILAWSHAATSGLKLALRVSPDLPTMPTMPDGPKLPDAPVPTPK